MPIIRRYRHLALLNVYPIPKIDMVFYIPIENAYLHSGAQQGAPAKLAWLRENMRPRHYAPTIVFQLGGCCDWIDSHHPRFCCQLSKLRFGEFYGHGAKCGGYVVYFYAQS